MKKYICKICGHVYDPALNGGVSFEDLPAKEFRIRETAYNMGRSGLWKCPICGAAKDKFEAIHHLGEPDTGGETQNKHVPVIEKVEGGVKVKVGAVAHPMIAEHYIMTVSLYDGVKVLKKIALSAGQAPEAMFDVAYKDGMRAVAHCNIHGYWESNRE